MEEHEQAAANDLVAIEIPIPPAHSRSMHDDEVAVSSCDAGGHVRLRHLREPKQVGVQLIGVG